VFFVEQGFISMVAEADGSSLGTEVGLIGREGMVGLPALLGSQAASYNRAMVPMPGTAHRLAARALRDNADALPVLWRLLLQALEVSMAQVATAACNSRHTIAHRLARWLLMAHDRVDGDELALTQEFLGTMLAVRRSGVTKALGSLQAAAVVDQRRGHVTICDRPGPAWRRRRAAATGASRRSPPRWRPGTRIRWTSPLDAAATLPVPVARHHLTKYKCCTAPSPKTYYGKGGRSRGDAEGQ